MVVVNEQLNINLSKRIIFFRNNISNKKISKSNEKIKNKINHVDKNSCPISDLNWTRNKCTLMCTIKYQIAIDKTLCDN